MRRKEITLMILSFIVGALVAIVFCTKHYTEVVDDVKAALSVSTQKAHALCEDGVSTGSLRMLQLQCDGVTEFCLCGDPAAALKDVDFDFNLEEED